MYKSLGQIRRDERRYVKLKRFKATKLSYICKLYRKLFLKLEDKVQKPQLRQLKLYFFGRGRMNSRDRTVRKTGRSKGKV